MPSTRRSSDAPPRRNTHALGCGVTALAFVGLLVAMFVWFPEQPDHPRFHGAGAEERQAGGTFVFHHEDNVRSLDPHIAYDELSAMAIRLVFDGLLDYDEESQLVPSIATAMPTVTGDGKVFTFQLRRGVRFHPMPGLPEGREVTAEDVSWSLHRMLSGETGSPGAPFFYALDGAEAYHDGEASEIAGIEVLGPHQIRFTLHEADQTFLNAIAMPFAYPVPRENYEHWGEEVKFHPVGAGPFVFEAWERDVELSFTRFDRYFDPVPRPDRMVYVENLNRTLAAQRLQNGDLDAIHRQSPSDYRFFSRAEGWQPYLEEYPRVSTFAIGFNCGMEPFDNVHLRRAMAFAIDREGWSRARAGRLLPADQILPPSLPGHTENLPNAQRFDLDVAREEMRLAGYENGLPDPITVWITGSDEVSRMYGELLQADLRVIGVDVELRFVSFTVYLTESGKPNTVPAMFTGWNQDFPDPANFLDILFHQRSIQEANSQNKSFYRNPELDALLDRARGEPDRERRIDMYREASDIISRDAPWAFTYYPMTMEVWQPYVRGYAPHPVWSQDYRNVWLDLPRERVARQLTGHGRAVPAQVFALPNLLRPHLGAR